MKQVITLEGKKLEVNSKLQNFLNERKDVKVEQVLFAANNVQFFYTLICEVRDEKSEN